MIAGAPANRVQAAQILVDLLDRDPEGKKSLPTGIVAQAETAVQLAEFEMPPEQIAASMDALFKGDVPKPAKEGAGNLPASKNPENIQLAAIPAAAWAILPLLSAEQIAAMGLGGLIGAGIGGAISSRSTRPAVGKPILTPGTLRSAADAIIKSLDENRSLQEG